MYRLRAVRELPAVLEPLFVAPPCLIAVGCARAVRQRGPGALQLSAPHRPRHTKLTGE